MKDLDALLGLARAQPQLKEKSPGCFYHKNRGVLHFHTKQGRRFAHVSDGITWHEVELPWKISVRAQETAFKKFCRLLPS